MTHGITGEVYCAIKNTWEKYVTLGGWLDAGEMAGWGGEGVSYCFSKK